VPPQCAVSVETVDLFVWGAGHEAHLDGIIGYRFHRGKQQNDPD